MNRFINYIMVMGWDVIERAEITEDGQALVKLNDGTYLVSSNAKWMWKEIHSTAREYYRALDRICGQRGRRPVYFS